MIRFIIAPDEGPIYVDHPTTVSMEGFKECASLVDEVPVGDNVPGNTLMGALCLPGRRPHTGFHRCFTQNFDFLIFPCYNTIFYTFISLNTFKILCTMHILSLSAQKLEIKFIKALLRKG